MWGCRLLCRSLVAWVLVVVLVLDLAPGVLGQDGPAPAPAAVEPADEADVQVEAPAADGAGADPDPYPEPVPGTLRGLPDDDVVLVRDEAGLFDAPLHAALKLQLMRLRRDARVDVFLVTRALRSLDETELTAYDLFKSLVREVQHYKVILVFVGIDRAAGQGMISTNLGAGVYHLIDRKDCEGLFVREGEPFSPEGIKQGVSFLSQHIRKNVEDRRRADVVTGGVPDAAVRDGARPWVVATALAIVVLAGGVGWFLVRRQSRCPRCGTELRTRVNIVVGTGGSDLARKTYKCFNCGYTRRRALLPTALVARKKV